jgi:hypothetical protein
MLFERATEKRTNPESLPTETKQTPTERNQSVSIRITP